METRIQNPQTAMAHWQGVEHALCEHHAPEDYSEEEKAAFNRGRYDEIDCIAASDPSRPVPWNGVRCPSDTSPRY